MAKMYRNSHKYTTKNKEKQYCGRKHGCSIKIYATEILFCFSGHNQVVFVLFLQLFCPMGIFLMGNLDFFLQEKPTAEVALPNLWCMLGVLVFHD